MTNPPKHDWPKIIREIEANGCSLYKIAIMMQRQYVQVQRWLNGVEPKHYDGAMLLTIHSQYVPRESLQNEPSDSQNGQVSA